MLAELNRLRTDLDKDPTDPEWFALHHAFCFVSYKIGEFEARLDETVKPDEHPEDSGMSDAPAPKKRKWKDTLHLPKTDFAMRFGLRPTSRTR